MQIARVSRSNFERPAVRWRERLTAALALLLVAAGTAHAAADCSITAVGVNFGAYDPLATAADDSTATVTVACRYVSGAAERVKYSVTLSNGMNGSSATTRKMKTGTSGLLGYNVFADPARTRVWGNGSDNTVIATGEMIVGPGNGNGTRTFTHTVYGRIPQLQDAVPGTYSDAVLLTLTF